MDFPAGLEVSRDFSFHIINADDVGVLIKIGTKFECFSRRQKNYRFILK